MDLWQPAELAQTPKKNREKHEKWSFFVHVHPLLNPENPVLDVVLRIHVGAVYQKTLFGLRSRPRKFKSYSNLRVTPLKSDLVARLPLGPPKNLSSCEGHKTNLRGIPRRFVMVSASYMGKSYT